MKGKAQSFLFFFFFVIKKNEKQTSLKVLARYQPRVPFLDHLLSMKFILAEGKHLHEECSTLVLPALSIGNVGQLAVDLLVETMEAQRAGYLDTPFVLPCVGNDAYGSVPQGDLALPIEAYDSPSNALTLVQQRSPVVKGMMIDFAKHLADYAVSSGKKHVVVLSSLDFGRWQKIDVSSGLQVHYLSNTNKDGTDAHCEELGWKRLQEYDPEQRSWKYLNALAGGSAMQEEYLPLEDEQDKDEDYYPSLPFSALYSCFKARGLKVTCILCYCSEGDNVSDAFHLAEAACKYLGLSISNSKGNEGGKWLIPFSWKTLYGPPPDISIF